MDTDPLSGFSVKVNLNFRLVDLVFSSGLVGGETWRAHLDKARRGCRGIVRSGSVDRSARPGRVGSMRGRALRLGFGRSGLGQVVVEVLVDDLVWKES